MNKMQLYTFGGALLAMCALSSAFAGDIPSRATEPIVMKSGDQVVVVVDQDFARFLIRDIAALTIRDITPAIASDREIITRPIVTFAASKAPALKPSHQPDRLMRWRTRYLAHI